MSEKEIIQEKYNNLRTLWLDCTDTAESVKLVFDMKALKDKYPDLIEFERVPYGHPGP